MKALVCKQPGQLEILDRPLPAWDNGSVMIRVRRVGLCGTDYHIFHGKHPFLEYPRVMGHELSGEVTSAPAGSAFTEGDRVIVNPYLPCGKCIACRKGKPNCCTNIKVLGVHGDGGMCEYICLPESAVYPAGNLTLDQGAMVEFLAVGAHGVRRSRVASGDRALIVGIGPIGLGTALAARLEGADVFVMDTNAARLEKARNDFGFEQAVLVSETSRDELAMLTDNEFFDVVYDCTGQAKAIENGFSLVAHGGTYVLLSVVKDDITFSDPEFHQREMSLIGSRNATRQDFEYVIDKIEKGDIPTDKLHTHSCEIVDLPVKLPEWSNGANVVLKAIAEI